LLNNLQENFFSKKVKILSTFSTLGSSECLNEGRFVQDFLEIILNFKEREDGQ
jgi:hypothetical protein